MEKTELTKNCLVMLSSGNSETSMITEITVNNSRICLTDKSVRGTIFTLLAHYIYFTMFVTDMLHDYRLH